MSAAFLDVGGGGRRVEEDVGGVREGADGRGVARGEYGEGECDGGYFHYLEVVGV